MNHPKASTTLEELRQFMTTVLRQFMATATCDECREEAWALIITLQAPGVIPVKINFATECEHDEEIRFCNHPVKTIDRIIKPCKLEKGHNGGHNPF